MRLTWSTCRTTERQRPKASFFKWLDAPQCAFDARGHGDSDKPHDKAAYTMARRAGDVIAVLDHAGVDRAHFYGVSLGGLVGYGWPGTHHNDFAP